MIPIDRVIKNQSLFDDKKLDFDHMTVAQLNYYYKKYKSLKNNANLMNKLKDKGEKVTVQLAHIEEIIRKRCSNGESTCNNKSNNENKSENNVPSIDELLGKFKEMNVLKEKQDASEQKANKREEKILKLEKKIVDVQTESLDKKFQRLTDTIDDEEIRKEFLEDLKAPENMIKIEENSKNSNENNYFLLKTTKTIEIKKENKPKTEKDLIEFTKRLREKYKKERIVHSAKSIPINESIKLIQEQTKRVQELQMQQAAQKLLEGKSINTFDYSLGDTRSEKLKKYRDNTKANDEYNSDHELNSDNYDEDEDNDATDSDNDFPRISGYEIKSKKFNLLRSNNNNDSDNDNDELNKID